MLSHSLPVLLTMTLAAGASIDVAGATEASVTAAVAAFDQGAFDEAERILLRRLAAAGDDHAASYELARTRVALARYASALEAVDRAVTDAPNDARYHRLRGEILGRMAQEASVFKQLGLAKRGLVAFEKAVTIDPRYVAARESVLEYYLRAPGFVGGSLAKARAQADALLDVVPAKGHRAHGRIHRYRDETTEALADYRAAVEAAPDDRDIRYDFATYLVELERWEEVRAQLAAMLGAPADDFRALHVLGRVAAESGTHLDAGKDALERYLGQAPRFGHPPHAEAHYWLGRVQIRQGEVHTARAAFQAALDLDPEHDEAKKALRRLR